MNLVNKCILAVIMIVIPTLAGGIWSCLLNKDKLNTTITIYCKLLLQAWIYGTISMFAVMQLIAIPMISWKMPFSRLVTVFGLIVFVMVAAGMVCWCMLIKKLRTAVKTAGLKAAEGAEGHAKDAQEVHAGNDIGQKVWIGVLAAIAIILIGVQARISSRYQHTDDDDARFIVLELIAVERDEMLLRSPIDGNNMYWNVGEVRKDYTSPWTMYVAAISRISGIAPAILSHRMLPMFLIPLCYAAWLMLAGRWFRQDWEKIWIFMILLSAVSIFGYTSTHTAASLMLLRIWQGKAVFVSLMIPVMLDIIFRIYDEPYDLRYKGLLFVACMAASLLSGGGIILSIILIGVYGLVMLFRCRSLLNALTLWLTCIPAVIYSLCYYFWYQIFGLM